MNYISTDGLNQALLLGASRIPRKVTINQDADNEFKYSKYLAINIAPEGRTGCSLRVTSGRQYTFHILINLLYFYSEKAQCHGVKIDDNNY